MRMPERLCKAPACIPGALVSAARVTLQHRGFTVTHLSHDLDGPLAVRAQGDLGAGHQRDDPEGPFAAAALGGRSQSDPTIFDDPSSGTFLASHHAAPRLCPPDPPVPGPSAGLFGQRGEDRATAGKRAGVIVRLAGRPGRAAALRVGTGHQPVDRQVARRRHRPIEVRAVNHHREQHRTPHRPRLTLLVRPRRAVAPPATRAPSGPDPRRDARRTEPRSG